MKLAYEQQGVGPALILLHGFPLDRSMWSSLGPIVCSRYRLITPDLRGFGETPNSGLIHEVDIMADDVIELIDSLKIEGPLVVGGLSMGGYVALSIATRHAERLRGLVLLNSRAEADTPEAAANRQKLANEIEASGDPTSFLEGMLSRMFASTTVQNQPELVEHWRHRMFQIPVQTIVSTLRGLAIRPDRSADLVNLPMPTLVIAGSEDQIVPREETRRMEASIPDGRLVVVSSSGHLSPLENPEATGAALLDFLDRIA